MVKLFADDTKVYATVKNMDERDSLQSDIDRLMNWSDTWLLKFVSSANSFTMFLITSGRSFMYIVNKIGPRHYLEVIHL
jgi:hypothetical protein